MTQKVKMPRLLIHTDENQDMNTSIYLTNFHPPPCKLMGTKEPYGGSSSIGLKNAFFLSALGRICRKPCNRNSASAQHEPSAVNQKGAGRTKKNNGKPLYLPLLRQTAPFQEMGGQPYHWTPNLRQSGAGVPSRRPAMWRPRWPKVLQLLIT